MSDDKKNKKELEKEELKRELKEELMEEIKKEAEENSFSNRAKDTVNKLMDTDDDTNKYDKKDIDKNKVMAVLAYLGPLVLVPLLASKDSKFASYHSKQGLNIFIYEVIVGVASNYITKLFTFTRMCGTGNLRFDCGFYTPLWVSIPLNLIQIFLVVLALVGLIYACQGKAKEVPIMNKIKIIK